MMVLGTGGERNEELVLNEESVWEDEKVSGDGRWSWLDNNVNAHNATEPYA